MWQIPLIKFQMRSDRYRQGTSRARGPIQPPKPYMDQQNPSISHLRMHCTHSGIRHIQCACHAMQASNATGEAFSSLRLCLPYISISSSISCMQRALINGCVPRSVGEWREGTENLSSKLCLSFMHSTRRRAIHATF